MMKKTQFRLVEVAKIVGVDYDWLYYRLSTGQTPLSKKYVYTLKDIEKLKEWLAGQTAAAK